MARSARQAALVLVLVVIGSAPVLAVNPPDQVFQCTIYEDDGTVYDNGYILMRPDGTFYQLWNRDQRVLQTTWWREAGLGVFGSEVVADFMIETINPAPKYYFLSFYYFTPRLAGRDFVIGRVTSVEPDDPGENRLLVGFLQ